MSFLRKSIVCYVMILLALMGRIHQVQCNYFDMENLKIDESDRRPPKKPVVPVGISPTAVRQCGAHSHWNPICGAWPSLCKEESCFEFLNRVSKPGELDCIGWTCDPGCICDDGPEVAWAVYKATYNKAYPTDAEHQKRENVFKNNVYLVEKYNKVKREKLCGVGEDADTASMSRMPTPTDLSILDQTV